MKYTFHFFSFLFFFIIGGMVFAKTGPQPGIEILASNENEFVFSFSPERMRTDTVRLRDRIYGLFSFDGAVPFGKAGDPNIPCRILSVGVPTDGDVSITVLDAVVNRSVALSPVPIADMDKRGDMAANVYVEGSSYKEAGVVPSDLCRAEAPEWSGIQRMVRVLVFPVRFHPAAHSVEWYSKISVRIAFQATQSVQSWSAVTEDRYFRNAVLNYPVAKNWQAKPILPARKLEKAALTGTWFKISVSQAGVFKITGSFLKGRGVDIASIQTATLKICNNGGRELPRELGASRPDSLVENPILLFGMEDGRFDESDYLLFYGKGVSGWEYDPSEKRWSHYNNIYSTKNIYWLGFNDGKSGKRIQTASAPSNPAAAILSESTDRFFYEQDSVNPLDGGVLWLAHEFDAASSLSNSFTLDLTLPDLVQNDSVSISIRYKGGENDWYATHQFSVTWNGTALPRKQFSYAVFYKSTDALAGGGIAGKNSLTLTYNANRSISNAYLDWVEIEYRRLLKAYTGRLFFYSPLPAGEYSYALTDFTSEPVVLDVTRYSDVRRLSPRKEGANWIVTDDVVSSSPKQYVAVQESAMLSPEDMQQDNLSNLRNPQNRADLIMIVHRDFMEQAQRLKSFKETRDSLSVFLTDVQDVYDEFGCGLLDPAAIRDFVRYAFSRWAGRPSFLLLFGDGSYDYRNILTGKNSVWIPPYESEDVSASRTTDDWYVTVAGDDAEMDLAVGRIPVQTKEQAGIVVDKLIQYQSDPDRGDWRALITIVGDDEKSASPETDNEVRHIYASEDIAEYVVPASLNLKKIYLTDYPEEMQVEGRRKPKAKEALLDQINQGTLLVNYIGHANANIWAHEGIFNHETDLPTLRNAKRLPLFYAATCSFAWFDDVDKQSFGEDLLTAEGKGAIAVIAASRECMADANEALDKEFVRAIFSYAKSGFRIGEALRLAKQNTYSLSNNELYNIMGDPTLRLAIPVQPVTFSEMQPDSLQALSLISVKGYLGKNEGDFPHDQGKVLLKSFDSKKAVTYTTKWGTRLNYLHPGNVLFKGEAKVENGSYRISFIVPKEITYGSSTGRLSAYFWNDSGDGLGSKDGIAVGGTANILDDRGPEIRMAFSGMEQFISGGMVPEDPELVVFLKDEQTGINMTGEIGHILALSIDGQAGKNVTDYFQYDEGSYFQGRLRYPLIGLAAGNHEMSFKAWDNANNSSTQVLVFQIVPQEDLRLEDVMNYPNPFSKSTHFTFQMNRNAEVVVKIYTIEGRMIRKLDAFSGSPGFNMIPWDGLDDAGDEIANGAYLYKIMARAQEQDETLEKSEIGKLLIMR